MYYWTIVDRDSKEIRIGEINLATGKVRIYIVRLGTDVLSISRRELDLKEIRIEGKDVVVNTDKGEIKVSRADLGSYLPTGYDDLVRNANGVFAEASKILESGSSGDP